MAKTKTKSAIFELSEYMASELTQKNGRKRKCKLTDFRKMKNCEITILQLRFSCSSELIWTSKVLELPLTNN